jgi:hypothetical protein
MKFTLKLRLKRLPNWCGTLIQAPGSRIMGFQPTVLRAEPNRELRWRGRLWMPGLFDGEHSFIVEAHGPDRARFVQHETFPDYSSHDEPGSKDYTEMKGKIEELLEEE